MNYLINEDIRVICELLNCTQAELARQIGVSNVTISRWMTEQGKLSADNMEKLYNYAYGKGLRLNRIKEQLYLDEYRKDGYCVLFHGSKSGLEGNISLSKSKVDNDFGKGFYCGETFDQAAMFVSGYPSSSVYILGFDQSGLSGIQYHVDQEWMLTVACFRGKLNEYSAHPMICTLAEKAEKADYIIAPIADNRMFELIDSFIEGEITDIQCRNSLSATNLGYQYVLKSEKAVDQLSVLRQCYLCSKEKQHYLSSRREEMKISSDKVKIAKRSYRGQGLYIEELLKE